MIHSQGHCMLSEKNTNGAKEEEKIKTPVKPKAKPKKKISVYVLCNDGAKRFL